MKWERVEGSDPDAVLYEPIFEAMARADRISRNGCPCGCFALLGPCTREDATGEEREASTR